MPNQSRKTFIKQIGLTGAALLMQQINAFSKNSYNFWKKAMTASNDNVN